MVIESEPLEVCHPGVASDPDGLFEAVERRVVIVGAVFGQVVVKVLGK